MDLLSDIWNLWLLVDEPIGTVLGLVVVWLLIRENVAWQLGAAAGMVAAAVVAGAATTGIEPARRNWRHWPSSWVGWLETHARAVWQDCCSIQIG